MISTWTWTRRAPCSITVHSCVTLSILIILLFDGRSLIQLEMITFRSTVISRVLLT